MVEEIEKSFQQTDSVLQAFGTLQPASNVFMQFYSVLPLLRSVQAAGLLWQRL
jgi:hypothetical protein